MLLTLVENIELSEKFLTWKAAVAHFNEHVTKTHKEFFDHIFDEIDFTDHKDKLPPIVISEYIQLAEKLQDEPRANSFVIQDIKKSEELSFVKFRKIYFSDLFRHIKNMREDYIEECKKAGDHIFEREDYFIKALNKIHDFYYEVVFFAALGKNSPEVIHGGASEGELRTISYYITSNIRYLFLRKVGESPEKYNKKYFSLAGITSEKYREIVSEF